jgi:hypothetical protein
MSKYYTPDISEFHEGFEYQGYNKYKGEWFDDVWNVITDVADNKLYYWDPDECRVKYLDKEDIISLGWDYIEDSDRFICKNSPNYSLSFTHLDGYDAVAVSIYETHKEDENMICNIRLKNKSELKKLLKQLGIDV